MLLKILTFLEIGEFGNIISVKSLLNDAAGNIQADTEQQMQFIYETGFLMCH